MSRASEAFEAILKSTPPHCDQSVLHAPGECRYCDDHPDWQALRKFWGIAFTGHRPESLYKNGPMEAPCPSDFRRGYEDTHAHTWGGNRPTEAVDTQHAETLDSRMMYPDLPGRDPDA